MEIGVIQKGVFRRMEACPPMLTYLQSTLRLGAGHPAIAPHFIPPIACLTAQSIICFSLILGRKC